MRPTALIAEDEPLLAQALRNELAAAWPELQVVDSVGDGAAAVRSALQHRPDVLFLDIRMPGQGGLDAATDLADAWPQDAPFPAIVFVTAYDQYAVQAFDAQAVDYLLKPLQPARLRKTVDKLKQVPARREAQGSDLEATLGQLRHLLRSTGPAAPAEPLLQVIQASVGTTIRLVPVEEVVYFEAADKYVRVLTAQSEVLIRTPLRDLLPRLDPHLFWQVHRGTVVRVTAIESVHRDEAGKLRLALRGRPDSLPVSRLYAHLFKAM